MNLLFLRSFGGVDDLGLFSHIQIILSPLPYDWGPASGTCRRRPRGPSPTRKCGLRGQNHLKNQKKLENGCVGGKGAGVSVPCVRGAARPSLPPLRTVRGCPDKTSPGITSPGSAQRCPTETSEAVEMNIESKGIRMLRAAPTPHPAGPTRAGVRGDPGERSPPPGVFGDSAELLVHILPPKSTNPSRSEPCLGFQTPCPHSVPRWKGPWDGCPPAGTRVSHGQSAERPRRSLPRPWEAAARQE